MKSEQQIKELFMQTLEKIEKLDVSNDVEMLFMVGYEQAIRDVLEVD